MRIFLLWTKTYGEIKPLVAAIRGAGHHIVYWTPAEGGDEAMPDIGGAICHSYQQAYSGLPAKEFRIGDFPPPSRQFIKKHSQLESLVLTLMNKHFEHLFVDERKHIYYNMLQYWYGILQKYRPEVIVFTTVPHSVFNYTIYELARQMGIKTMMFDEIELPDRVLFYSDWRRGDIDLQNEIKNNLDKKFKIEDLSEDMQEYYRPHLELRFDAAPPLTKIIAKQHSGIGGAIRWLKIIADVLKKGLFIKKTGQFIVKQFKPNLKKEYQSLAKQPDFSKPFVYAPLHFQPERTICPQGDVFWDQILMVETLSYSLPSGWQIYVKEHPDQWLFRRGKTYSSNRYQGYYKRLAQIDDVRIVPIETNSFALIAKCRAVATSTGTAGWEAVMRGKPAIIFGYPWYRDFVDLLKVDSPQTCREAFEKIISGFSPRKQQVINYLKSVENATTKGFLTPQVWLKTPKEQSIDNISKKVLAKLSEFSKKNQTLINQ